MKRGTVNCFVVFFLMIFTVVTISGCDERVRKKFVRERNADKKSDEVDVIYQPIEYSSDYFDPSEQYTHHFQLWRAWHTDLKAAFESNESQKRKKYLLEHEIDALRSMQYWLVAEKQKDFDDLIAMLMKINTEMAKPEALQDDQGMARYLDIIRSKIQGEYDLSHVQNHLIPKP